MFVAISPETVSRIMIPAPINRSMITFDRKRFMNIAAKTVKAKKTRVWKKFVRDMEVGRATR